MDPYPIPMALPSERIESVYFNDSIFGGTGRRGKNLYSPHILRKVCKVGEGHF
jgi:hypothetical protein